jgi:hypothetical protein
MAFPLEGILNISGEECQVGFFRIWWVGARRSKTDVSAKGNNGEDSGIGWWLKG